MAYDIIGDIHGYASKLRALLDRLGYSRSAAGWTPPSGRQAVFLGDFIDRGPEQVEVIEIVRSMIDRGHARTVMGNHEYNAIAYATPDRERPGEFLRRHSMKNVHQHREFLAQVGEGSSLHRELIDWFRTLPTTLDLGHIRVVHAWWHQPYVDFLATRLADDGVLDDDLMHAAAREESPEWRALEGLTKGLEVNLPPPHTFVDHSGIERSEARTRWWHDDARSFRDVVIVSEEQVERMPDHPLPADYLGAPVDGTPVFVGHYWMTGSPRPLTRKVACVDYSAAWHGPLVAYRWDGEQELDESRFVASEG